MTHWIRYGGLVVAGVGFAVTRFVVAETLTTDAALPFLLAGLLPLAIGLSLSVYGVALAVGAFSEEYVNTVARWSLLGTGVMAIVFTFVSVDPIVQGDGLQYLSEAPLLVSNVLLAGTVGGAVIGDRSARNRRERRKNHRQANRALFVNRLLRHEVLNAAAIIDGHADLIANGRKAVADDTESTTAIRTAADRIRRTVTEVGTVAEPVENPTAVDLTAVLDDRIESLEAEHPDVTVSRTNLAIDTTIMADARIGHAITELLENAVAYGNGAAVETVLDTAGDAVTLTVCDDGGGLPAEQRALLEAGEFSRYDDPSTGFGLQVVHLLTTKYGGEVRVADREDGGTAITLVLPRSGDADLSMRAIDVTFPNLYRAVVAGVVAGFVMGAIYQTWSGLLPVIGTLYGVSTPIVGWVTHLFHSVVFALIYAAGLTRSPTVEIESSPTILGGIGLVWGALLWLVAAGIIMPVWLSLVGSPTALPNLSGLGLLGHSAWGIALGMTYWWLGSRDVAGE